MVRKTTIILVCLLLAALSVSSLRCNRPKAVVGGQPSSVNVQQTDKWVHIPNADSRRWSAVSSQLTTDHRLLTPIQSNTASHCLWTVDSIPHDTVYLAVDTAQILRDYFTQHLYREVYSDHLLDIEVTDSIYQNRLISQSVRYTTKPKKMQAWVMATLDTRKTASIHLLVKDKRERVFGLGYTSDKAIALSIGFPLFKAGGTH